ncbi:hypothetical protein [Iningainema tapete]|uniref:Uncharacterized protein n=1 Tax=Iningainema tapete BLCC-T55 TaxID=2748662 RepID=A0A8J7C5T8_9CYAN|nr:hypothetical protein [Iningainema tapete]MBD2771181.1 hypothetical protein [Iningainema tapete BLCC-T55]
MESELRLLQQQQQLNRRSREQKIMEEPLQGQQKITTISGYDPVTGLTKLIDQNGASFYGSSITSGAVGKGENIRLRRGEGLFAYDSMPHVYPTIPQQITKSEPIIVGLLCDIPINLQIPDLGKYKSSNCIHKIFLNGGQNLEASISPVGLFIGTLKNNSTILEKLVINDISDFYPSDGYGEYSLEWFSLDSYYSMGYDSQILKYITNFKLPEFYSTTTYVTDAFNIAAINLSILEFKVTEKESNFTSLTFRSNSEITFVVNSLPYVTEQVLVNKNVFLIKALKYKSINGEICYVLIGGRTGGDSLSTGIIVWDIGKISNLQSKSNIACYFGFDWGSSAFPNAEKGFRLIDAYGTSGGIVINVVLIGQNTSNSAFEIFIPEAFLKGENGIKVEAEQLIFSNLAQLNNAITQESFTINVGSIPEPLETREFIAPFKIPKYQPENGKEKKLILYSLFSKEKGRQVFS